MLNLEDAIKNAVERICRDRNEDDKIYIHVSDLAGEAIRQHAKILHDMRRANEEAQELTKAKADWRLVELPCKIGDEVWFLEKQLDITNGTCSTVISEYIVTEIRGNKYNPLWYMASSERCTHRDFHPTEIGKTVFLARGEAEKALQEGLEWNKRG
jgi:nitrous oxide reductase